MIFQPFHPHLSCLILTPVISPCIYLHQFAIMCFLFSLVSVSINFSYQIISCFFSLFRWFSCLFPLLSLFIFPRHHSAILFSPIFSFCNIYLLICLLSFHLILPNFPTSSFLLSFPPSWQCFPVFLFFMPSQFFLSYTLLIFFFSCVIFPLSAYFPLSTIFSSRVIFLLSAYFPLSAITFFPFFVV